MGFDIGILAILSITALSNSAYAIVAPFMPFEFANKGISQQWVGYVFAIFSVSVIFISPIIGKLINKVGRRSLIQFGVLLMGVSFILFGCL